MLLLLALVAVVAMIEVVAVALVAFSLACRAKQAVAVLQLKHKH
jgi:hypothetical protein